MKAKLAAMKKPVASKSTVALPSGDMQLNYHFQLLSLSARTTFARNSAHSMGHITKKWKEIPLNFDGVSVESRELLCKYQI